MKIGMIGCGGHGSGKDPKGGRAVRKGRPSIASAEEIARTPMPVLDAARRSDLEKRIVVLGE